MLLACARGLLRTDAALAAGRPASGRRRRGVRGKTLGLVGLGPSSACCRARARPGHDRPRLRARERHARARGARAGRAGAAFYAEADFLVVAAAPVPALVGAASWRSSRPAPGVVGLGGPTPSTTPRSRGACGRPRGRRGPGRRARRGACRLARAARDAPSAAEASTVDARLRAGHRPWPSRWPPSCAAGFARRGQRACGGGRRRRRADAVHGSLRPAGAAARAARRQPVDAVEISYGGSVAYFDTRLLTLGVLGGVLPDRVDVPVNFVNAQVIAESSA